MGALARDTGGTITGAGTLRSRASIGAVGSRTTALAGGSVGTTCFVVGSGAGGFGVSGSVGAVSLTVGRGAGGFSTAGSFESASGNDDAGSSAVAVLGASAGTISLAVGNRASGSGTTATLAPCSAISPRPGNEIGASSTFASLDGTTGLTLGGIAGSRVAALPSASVEAV